MTRLRASTGNWAAENATANWYHPDHLGSTSVVTDPDGEAYERIEYTPFGEMWLEHQHDANTRGEGYIPYRFTSKEWDEETGLYYYGARYLEPKLSRWMSADPAGFGLVNPMEQNNEGKLKAKQDYSTVEVLNWYSYVSNNLIRYIDPTGKRRFLPVKRASEPVFSVTVYRQSSSWESTFNEGWSHENVGLDRMVVANTASGNSITVPLQSVANQEGFPDTNTVVWFI